MYFWVTRKPFWGLPELSWETPVTLRELPE